MKINFGVLFDFKQKHYRLIKVKRVYVEYKKNNKRSAFTLCSYYAVSKDLLYTTLVQRQNHSLAHNSPRFDPWEVDQCQFSIVSNLGSYWFVAIILV